MQKEFEKVRPQVVGTWFDEMRRSGHVVLRTSVAKTVLFALIAWAIVAFIVVTFSAVPISTWIPFSGSGGGGVLQFLLGLVFIVGLLLFGFGALLWTFIFPVVRPRMIVSWWGVQSIGWKPGGAFTLFSAPWASIVRVDGMIVPTRRPFPPTLHVVLTAHASGVQRAPWIRARSKGPTVVYGVNTMLRGRRREIMAFLMNVHETVRTQRDDA